MDLWSSESCRACLQREDVASMYPLALPEIMTLFSECSYSTISLPDDPSVEVPQHLCRMCYRLCELWQSFRKRCQETEEKLNCWIPDKVPSPVSSVVAEELFVKNEPLEDPLEQVLHWEEEEGMMDSSCDHDPDQLPANNNNSNESHAEANVLPQVPNAEKPAPKEWTKTGSFGSVEEAKAYLREEGIYGGYYTDKNFLTRYFRCNRVKRREKTQCASRVKLVSSEDPQSMSVTMYRSVEEHNHHLLVQVKQGLPVATKELLRTLVAQGKTMKQIKVQLKARHVEWPPSRQLNSLVQTYRRKCAKQARGE